MAKDLKVGDFVISKSGSSRFYGVVSEVDNGFVTIAACEVINRTITIHEQNLDKLTTTDPEAEPPYRAGDTVEISWERHPYRGKRAYIYQVVRGVKGNPDVLLGIILGTDETIPVTLLPKDVTP